MKNIITLPSTPILITDLGTKFPENSTLYKYRYGVYKCHCGNEFEAITTSIKRGHTKSCGCYNKEIPRDINTSHGLWSHKVYKTWDSMIQRCTNSKNKYFYLYGGRGIKVCDRWLKFENFRDDMLHSWADGLTIDRKNNDGNYEPDNCRWTTKNVQSRNTRIIHKHNTSGYRGVSFSKQKNKWVARICVNSKIKHIGLFQNSIEAAQAYDSYVIENSLEHNINGV